MTTTKARRIAANEHTRTLHITQIRAGQQVVTGRTVHVVTGVEPRPDLGYRWAADIYCADGSTVEHRDDCALVVIR